jgi:hypothetical protein
MAFKMNNAPYGGKRDKEMGIDKGGVPKMSKNFEKSGMKNADGSEVKPGAPGFFGKLLDPLGLRKKVKGLFGRGKGRPCPPAKPAGDAAAQPATPGVVTPETPAAPAGDAAAAEKP